MTPSVLWFPLTLIMYGEGSYCKTTRRCSRILLYCYLLTLMITAYMQDTQLAIIVSSAVVNLGYCYCMVLSQRPAGRVLFSVMIVLMTYITSAMIFSTFDYDIVIEGVSLLEHSSYVYREGSMIALSCVSFLTINNTRVNSRENLLGLVAVLMWVVV